MDTVIRTVKLTKKFKDVLAVSEISLSVSKGEIYGFLGLNGAGKTTTIRMLLGMISPDKGEAFINEQRVHEGNTELWKKTGYLVEMPFSYPNLTVRENLEIIRKLRFIKDKNAVASVMEKLRLTEYAGRKARNLSLGNAQRLGVAKALIHNPEILILDEPANGFDPAGICEFREMLRDLAKNHGVTIFISSHILGEISKLATRIGIIHRGVLIRELQTQQLEQLCQKRLRVNTLNNNLALSVLEKNGIKASRNGDGVLDIVDDEMIRHPESVSALLVNHQASPSMLHVVEEDLESYFLRTIKTTEMKGATL
jgi:ABC-2 type transport system ATP-binding protein